MSNQTTQTKRIYCRNQCGIEITFDNRKSKSGKSIPIEVGSGMPHQCPKSAYNLQQQQTQQTQVREPTVNELLHEVLFKLDVVQTQIRELKSLREFSP